VKPGTAKVAWLNDYWQYSATLDSRKSGINLTRHDFENMGSVITSYESNNSDLKAIEAIVNGSGENVIKDITQYFANDKDKASDADNLAGLSRASSSRFARTPRRSRRP
jgi:hypothetical protein